MCWWRVLSGKSVILLLLTPLEIVWCFCSLVILVKVILQSVWLKELDLLSRLKEVISSPSGELTQLCLLGKHLGVS